MREVRPTWKGAVFTCTHERDPERGRAWCGLERGGALRDWLKARAKAEGLKGVVLCAKSGCLGVCSPLGVTLAILPDPSTGREREVLVVPDDVDREELWRRVVQRLPGAES